MARLDDLTILLTAVDKTKQTFDKANKRMKAVAKVTEIAQKAFRLFRVTAVGALVAAANNGRQLTNELQSMARQTNLSLQEAQALFNAVREADASTNLDNLNEALLSIKERFADARVGAGPLKGLMDDFAGFELDLGVDNGRQQLANFLEQVSKLPDANAKIFALKEVIGDEDSRPFFNIINNTEKLNKLLVDLRTNVDDLPNIISFEQQRSIQDATRSTKELGESFNKLSIEIWALVSGPLATFNDFLIKITNGASSFIGFLTKLDERFGLVKKSIEGLNRQQLDIEFDDAVQEFKELQSTVAKLDPQNLNYLGPIESQVFALSKGFIGAETALESYVRKLDDADVRLKRVDLRRRELDGINGARDFSDVDVAPPTAPGPLDEFGGAGQDIKDTQKRLRAHNAIMESLRLEDEQKRKDALERFKVQARQEAEAAEKAFSDRLARFNSEDQLFNQEFFNAEDAAFAQPLEADLSAVQSIQDKIAEKAKEAAQVTRDAWFAAAGALGTVFDGLKKQVGGYIEITSAMSDVDKRAAEQANATNRKRFEDNKKWSRAQALLSAAVGIARALEAPPPLSFALAAQTAAAFAAQISSINRTTFGGGGNVSSVGGGNANDQGAAVGGTLQPQQTASNRTLNLTIEGDGNITSEQLERIVEGMIDNGFIDDGKIVRI